MAKEQMLIKNDECKCEIIPSYILSEMIRVRTSFYRDLFRKKYRNCVLILYQNRKVLTEEQFIQLFVSLVENTPVIDYVNNWDDSSQYKYYKLLDFYLFLLNKYVPESYQNT